MIEVEHEDPIVRTFILFTQTADAVLKYANAKLLRKAGISAIKLIVLQVLAANGGAMGPSKMAEWTLRERHNITTLVERMQRDGLVKAERNRRDRRFVNITLTGEGERALNEAMPIAGQIVSDVMATVSEEDILRLGKLLAVLRQNAHHGLGQIAKLSHPQPG